MIDFLFWLYLINSIFLINHEIDSAYWHEWNLFNPNDKHGINGFLMVHFPLLFGILYGLILLNDGLFPGLIFSVVLSLTGIFAFFFHFYHIKKGRDEFNTTMSKFILISSFIISIAQLIVSIVLLME